MNKVIGTCSICGGAVTVPYIWMGTPPPIPTCESCGATQRRPHGPVVDMEPQCPKEIESEVYNRALARAARDINNTEEAPE